MTGKKTTKCCAAFDTNQNTQIFNTFNTLLLYQHSLGPNIPAISPEIQSLQWQEGNIRKRECVNMCVR